jgi:hypothetical protein
LLSTDAEGIDETILKTLDLQRFRPGVIRAEGVSIHAKRQSLRAGKVSASIIERNLCIVRMATTIPRMEASPNRYVRANIP